MRQYRDMATGTLNLTGGVTYPAGYWLAAPAGSTLNGIPRDFQRVAGAEWLEWVALERERWYASLESGAPPEWNARGARSPLARRAGGAWAGAASTVQSLVSEELAAYWTDVAPRMNRAEYIAARWAECEAEREDAEYRRASAPASETVGWAPFPAPALPWL